MRDTSIRHLKSVDPVLATVIDRVGPCRLEPRREGTHFDALVRSIVYQQLSGKAASTILGRVHALYGDRSPTPAELIATPDETLRTAGLSRQKLSYLKDLAAKVESGDVPLASEDRKSTRLNSSHRCISYAVFCLKKKTTRSTPSTSISRPREARCAPTRTNPTSWPTFSAAGLTSSHSGLSSFKHPTTPPNLTSIR